MLSRMERRLFTVLVAGLCLAACGSKELLEPRDGTVPAGVDFTGNWQMRAISPEDRRRMTEAIRQVGAEGEQQQFEESVRGSTSTTQTRSRSRRNRSVGRGLVYVFLEQGRALKITQTEHGLFIRFDRSIV